MAREKHKQETKVLFVGGNNDVGIGANCIIVENTDSSGKKTRLMFDLGMKLCAEDPNYDGIVSDIREYLDKVDENGSVVEPAKNPIDAIFITHAHEDHRGGFNAYEAIGYKMPPKITSRTTAKIERNRINREGLNLNVSSPENVLSIDDMPKPIVGFGKNADGKFNVEVEAFNVSHSAVNSKGYHILVRKPDGKDLGLVITGDFNMREMQASFGDKQDGFDKEQYLDLISRKPVTHIFQDSTSSGSSDEFIFDKETCIDEWKKLIKKTEEDGKHEIFTENIANSVEHLLKLAEATRRFNEENNRTRKIYIDAGNLKLAYKAYVDAGGKACDDVIFDLDTKNAASVFNETVPQEDQIVVFSGAFAEGSENIPNSKGLKLPSGIVKLSNGEKVNPNQKDKNAKPAGTKTGHQFFKIGPNTAFVKAQRDVGINSKGIKKTMNKIAQLGAKIYQVATYDSASLGSNYSMHKIQSSGHASKRESMEFMNYHDSKKAIIIPIHGDMEQLETTASVAKEAGFKSNVYRNASSIELFQGGSKIIEEGQDELSYIAFRNEGMFREKVLVVDEVQVYQDYKNPNIEHICYIKNLGKHVANFVGGQWMDKNIIDGADAEKGGELSKKQLENKMAKIKKDQYFKNRNNGNG